MVPVRISSGIYSLAYLQPFWAIYDQEAMWCVQVMCPMYMYSSWEVTIYPSWQDDLEKWTVVLNLCLSNVFASLYWTHSENNRNFSCFYFHLVWSWLHVLWNWLTSRCGALWVIFLIDKLVVRKLHFVKVIVPILNITTLSDSYT